MALVNRATMRRIIIRIMLFSIVLSLPSAVGLWWYLQPVLVMDEFISHVKAGRREAWLAMNKRILMSGPVVDGPFVNPRFSVVNRTLSDVIEQRVVFKMVEFSENHHRIEFVVEGGHIKETRHAARGQSGSETGLGNSGRDRHVHSVKTSIAHGIWSDDKSILGEVLRCIQVQDFSRAKELLDDGERRGLPLIIREKASYIDQGILYRKDPHLAMQMWEKAVGLGSGRAALEIGFKACKFVEASVEIKTDHTNYVSLHWFIVAAELGDKTALRILQKNWTEESLEQLDEHFPLDRRKYETLTAKTSDGSERE